VGIADLPDIDEDEWYAYQADTFSRGVRPLSDSAAFMASTEPVVAGGLTQLASLQQEAEAVSRPVTTAPPPPATGPFGPGPFGGIGSVFGRSGTDGASSAPSSGDGLPDPSSLIDDSIFFSDGGADAQAYKVTTAPYGSDGQDGANPLQQMWQGDPSKPGFFSWAGEQVGRLTDAARQSGFSQTPVIGPTLTGAGEAVEQTLHGLGGSAQALRQGDVLGGLGGTASATLNAVGDIPRGIATEAQWPEQIIPGIDPDTPVIGGLNNPRELVGLATDLLIPETAVERLAGKAIGRVARPAVQAAGGALQRLGAGEAMGVRAGGVGLPGRGLTRAMSELPPPFDPDTDYLFPNEAESIPAFFSKLSQEVDRLPNRMTGPQALGTLRARGVKPDEMRWTGIEDYLSRSGSLAKRDIQDYLAQNQVQIREVVNEGPVGTPEYEAAMEQKRLADERYSAAYQAYVRAAESNMKGTGATQEQVRLHREAVDEAGRLAWLAQEAVYSQPLPQEVPGVPRPEYQTYAQPASRNPDAERKRGYREFRLTLNTPGKPIAPEYRTSHWPESQVPNTVVHFRVTDRTLPDGRKALHVEEVQSDWHETGRREGYRPETADYSPLLPEARTTYQPYGEAMNTYREFMANSLDERERLAEALQPYYTPFGLPNTNEVKQLPEYIRLKELEGQGADLLQRANEFGRSIDEWAFQDETRGMASATAGREFWDNEVARMREKVTEAEATHGYLSEQWKFWQNEMEDAQFQANSARDYERQATQTDPDTEYGPPRAPFEKTPAWTGLAMKRLLRLASEEGYDALTWTPAMVQAERYGRIFRNVADRLEYDPDRSTLYLRDPSGRVTQRRVPAADLPQWIGADRAQRLLESKRTPSDLEAVSMGPVAPREASFTHALDEAGINVVSPPSEGMTLQYETVMPQVMKEIGKPWGARSGVGEIELWPGGDRSQAHILEITPEMRGEVTERGFPLFAREGGGVGGLASRALTSPFFSPARTGEEAAADIALGTAGGVAGAATAEEDATWQERAGRFAVGASAAAGIGPTTRANLGRLGRLAGDETGSLGISGGRRQRQGIPDFGGARPPITPEEWEAMTPRQRRNARDAADAGRAYTPLSREEIARRASMREAQKMQEEIAQDSPELAPSEDVLPMAEPSGDVLERVLSEMTPEGLAAAEKWEQTAASPRLAGGWMKGFVRAAQEAPWEGGQRYDKILELTGGERATGEAVGKSMAEAEAAADYEPPRKLTKRERERLGNLRAMEQTLTPQEQELAERLRDNALDEMRKYHGFRSEADAQAAAEKILPFLVQFARNAQPNEPVSEALMLAGKQARAHATALANYAELEYDDLLSTRGASEEERQIAKQAADFWRAAAQLFARYGGEIAPSESGRTFRSMRNPPKPLVPGVTGGSGLDEVDAAMGEGMAEASEAAAKAAEGGTAPPTNRSRLTPREKAYQDLMGHLRKSRKGLEGEEKATARATARKAGKRPGSDLDAMGLEWADVVQRDPGAKGPITDDELVRVMAGLHDIGGYRMRRDWLPRARQLDMDDPEAVKRFWKEARAAGGLSSEGDPLVRFDPNVEGQSYLGGADTITKQQALSMVSKELLKDADEATAAVRRARVEGASDAELAQLEAAANTAYNRLGLNIKEWPEESFPIVERAMTSVRERIAKEWPADRPRGSGATEEVEKKRQLLALFDQEIKKEQKLAGLVPTNWLQDALSFGTSNVLSTPRFVQASILESALSAVNEPFQNFLKGNYGAAGQQLRGLGRAFGFTPSGSDLAKLGEGVKAPALVNAMKAFRDIGPMEAATELRDVATRGAGMIRSDSPNKKVMNVLAPMHRISRGISEAFHTANYFGEVNRLAHEAAESGVLPGGRRIERIVGEDGALRNPSVQELFGNLPQEIVDEALKTSKTITQGGDPGVIEKKLGDLKGLLNKPNATDWERTQGLFANLMFPFVYGLRPMIRTGTKTLFSAPVHGTEVAKALMRGDTEGAKYAAKKFALANAFNGFIAYQVMSGNITGHGPSDPATRQALMEATDENGDPIWRPDSIRLPTPDGNVWVKYTSMPGPVSIVSTVMGNIYDAYAFDGKQDETAPETAARMAQQLLPSILDNTYFRDFINLSEAMNANGGMNAMGRLAGQVAGRFVPYTGALRLGATLTDPYNRLTSNPLEDIQSGLPGLRQRLPAQVSAYTGEAVEQPLNPVTALGGLSGNVYASPSRENPAAREVAELNRRPLAMPQDWERTRAVGAPAPRTFTRGEQARGTEYAGMRQTGEAIRGAQQEFGREANRRLLPILDSPEYQRMTPQQKAARLEAVIGQEGTARESAEYAAKGRVQLTPEGRLERAMSQQPQFYGVSGSPAEVAAKNQQIKEARNVLASLASRYGKDMAMAMLAQRSPQALTLAVAYPPVERDELWLIEQRESANLGISPEAAVDTFVPDFGQGATTIPALSGGINRQQLPPSLRRLV
jgi:hypothetical protein